MACTAETTVPLLFVDESMMPDAASGADNRQDSKRAVYTRESLASALRLMGTKPRHSVKVAARVFDALEALARTAHASTGSASQSSASPRGLLHRVPRAAARRVLFGQHGAVLPRPQFDALVAWALADFQYTRPDQVDVLQLACSIHERKRGVVLLLCGTSGTGKSTLAALLAARMGITTIVSTDTIRGMLRGMTTEEENPLLYASTYQTGDYISVNSAAPDVEADPVALQRKRVVKGYKAQSALVMAQLERLLRDMHSRRESAIIEGVHLSLNLVIPLMLALPDAIILPFLVTISNEAKHRERFAVRAKYMSLSPEANRYVRYFGHIRTIQDYLVSRAARHAVPVLNNTNVDRSVDVMHATALGCARRVALGGEPLLQGDKLIMMHQEWEAHTRERGAWSSKTMLALIRARARDQSGTISDSSALTGGDEGPGGDPLEEADIDLLAATVGLTLTRKQASSDDDVPATASEVHRADSSDAGLNSDLGSVLESQAGESDEEDGRRVGRLETLVE